MFDTKTVKFESAFRELGDLVGFDYAAQLLPRTTSEYRMVLVCQANNQRFRHELYYDS